MSRSLRALGACRIARSDHFRVSTDASRDRAGIYGQSADSALKLGQARGAAMVVCALADLEVHEYATRQIKQAVVGTGGASKAQVQHMITRYSSCRQRRKRMPAMHSLRHCLIVVRP